MNAMQKTKMVESLRNEYRRAGRSTGLSADEFRVACGAYLRSIGVGTPGPRDWVDAAYAVKASLEDGREDRASLTRDGELDLIPCMLCGGPRGNDCNCFY